MAVIERMELGARKITLGMDRMNQKGMVTIPVGTKGIRTMSLIRVSVPTWSHRSTLRE
jgi:hypothetical protein